MADNIYAPEGMLLGTAQNREYISSIAGLEKAMIQGKILEGVALVCDSDMNLHVDLCGVRGIIPKKEVLFCRDGEELKDIAVITRVGKAVCFKVISIERKGANVRIILSRRAAQIECMHNYLMSLVCGDIIPAKVTHLEGFGAFVDIGCGLVSLLSVDCISVSRISHPSDRFSTGESIWVVIKSIDYDTGRIFVTHRELLGTWEENAAAFEVGQTVAGIVRSIESYGIFVELSPNLAGLAELRPDVYVGQTSSVYIKNIIPDKMKIKLVLIDSNRGELIVNPSKYYIDTSKVTHLDRWLYSPPSSAKVIESVFQ